MAEAIRKYECTICLDGFKKPKLLPCFHTFCEECLGQYIQTQAKCSKFNCPVCRTSIQVPVGGASGFTSNFYLDDEDQSHKHYCAIHKDKEAEFYCRECCVAVCSRCVIKNHQMHQVVELSEVKQESLIEEKIYQLKARKELLQLKSESIVMSATTACINIDTQVAKISAEAKKLGEKMTDEVNQLCGVEIENLQRLMDETDSLIAHLRTVVDHSHGAVTGKSTKSLNLETPAEDIKNLTDVTMVKHPYFPVVEMNIDVLKQQLGALQTMDGPTFTASFNLAEIKEKDVMYGSKDYIILGLPWYVFVKRNTQTSTLGVYLNLNKIADRSVKSCKADMIIKLLNPTDDSKSMEVNVTGCVYKPGVSGRGSNRFIDWNKLIDPCNGFINNNIFTVQATVVKTHIEK